MGNCVVELYSLDYVSSYQHAFVYIRQLALHLRSALQKKTPETFRVVYCWQYMHCLKLWTAVLAACSGKAGDGDDESALMRSLIYPLVEVIFGVARLIPSARHLPLRLHCVRFLQQLAAASETFIPTTSILLEVFDLKEINMAPKRVKKRKSDVRGVRLPVILKLPKEDPLRTAEQLDVCLGETFLLLNREVDLYKYSAGIPEFTVRINQRLKKFAKQTKNGKFRAYARGCIELCEKSSRSAMLARSKLADAPKDIKVLEILRPPNAPTMGERYEMAIAKERRLEIASQPDMSKKSATKKETKVSENKATPSKKAKNAPKKKNQVDEEALKNTGVLEEEDEVQEGIEWSDSESEED
jgi:nucleolar complex protein 2